MEPLSSSEQANAASASHSQAPPRRPSHGRIALLTASHAFLFCLVSLDNLSYPCGGVLAQSTTIAASTQSTPPPPTSTASGAMPNSSTSTVLHSSLNASQRPSTTTTSAAPPVPADQLQRCRDRLVALNAQQQLSSSSSTLLTTPPFSLHSADQSVPSSAWRQQPATPLRRLSGSSPRHPPRLPRRNHTQVWVVALVVGPRRRRACPRRVTVSCVTASGLCTILRRR